MSGDALRTDVPVIGLVGWLLLVLPVQAALRYRRLRTTRPVLIDYAFGVLRSWWLAGTALLALAGQRVPAGQVGLAWRVQHPGQVLPAVAVALCLGLVGTLVLRRCPRLLGRVLRPVAALLPRQRRERQAFVLVALTAGATEELLYRGFLTHEARLVGLSPLAALLAVSAAFGLAHLYQGLPGVAGTALAGYALGTLAVASGSLLLPVVLHALVDLRILLLVPAGVSGPGVSDGEGLSWRPAAGWPG